MGNRSVGAGGVFVGGKVGADVFDLGLARADLDAEVAGASLDGAAFVAVLRGAAGVVVAGVAGLGDLLIDDPVEILFHVEVVVAMEDDVDPVFEEELVDGQGSARALGGKDGRAVRLLAAPFVEGGRLRPAPGVPADAPHQVVQKDKTQGRLAFGEGRRKPVVLLAA